MRISVFVVAIYMLTLPMGLSALESRCFTDYKDIVADGSSQVFVSTEGRDDLFFTQDGNMIPSQKKPAIIRASFPYSMTSTLSSFPLNQSNTLTDDISSSQIEIDPLMASDGLSITLNFGSGLLKNTFVPQIDISSSPTYITEISDDGLKFVTVREYELSSYSFHYLRFTFPNGIASQSSTFLRTIRFDKKSSDIYIVEPPHYGQIDAYQGWICDTSKLSALISQRNALGKNIDISQEIKNPISVVFAPLPTTGKDSDSDNIIDMRDNCSTNFNPGQEDRNHDGIGDSCSDDDKDGISGNADNCPTVINLDQKDLNANNIGDACEFDTDKDSISDGADNCIQKPNPDQGDVDGDSIGDSCDNCDLYNPDQRDFNKNNLGDVCEEASLTQKNNDEDADGVQDSADNCIQVANTNQSDADGDSRGDMCDNCISIKNLDQSDENNNGVGEMCEDGDTDGIDGWRDNCISVNNPDQKDSNNDGVGNSCSDSDFDGVYDENDNCPAISNQDQKDIDNDMIGNMCDDKDNRLLESNRTLFMVVFGLISCLFIGGIIYFIRKLKI